MAAAPKLGKKERDARNLLILQMYLAGMPYQAIGDRVGLSEHAVRYNVKRGMKSAAPRREDLAEQAFAVYTERLEALWAAHFPKAVRGDVRSSEFCRRVLGQFGDLHGFTGQRQSTSPEQPVMVDVEDAEDELAKWRTARPRRA